jgi:SAM-dependent methyltransferase
MHKDKWNKRYNEQKLSGPGQPSPILVKTISDLEPGRALDLAAGQGRNAFYLAEQGWDTTAVDFSEVAVEKGAILSRELELPVRWQVRDLTQFTPPPAHYDLVCIFYLHMPWEEYRGVLWRAAAAVKPGGTLLVVGHDRSNLEQGSGGPQDPAVLYTPADITAAPIEGPSASPPSFEVLQAETQNNPVDHGHSGQGGEQIDCVVVARRRRHHHRFQACGNR